MRRPRLSPTLCIIVAVGGASAFVARRKPRSAAIAMKAGAPGFAISFGDPIGEGAFGEVSWCEDGLGNRFVAKRCNPTAPRAREFLAVEEHVHTLLSEKIACAFDWLDDDDAGYAPSALSPFSECRHLAPFAGAVDDPERPGERVLLWHPLCGGNDSAGDSSGKSAPRTLDKYLADGATGRAAPIRHSRA